MSSSVNCKRQMFLDLVKNNPGISSTSTILVQKLPDFKSDYKKPMNEVWDILKYLKDFDFIEERKGRLYEVVQ